MRRLLLIILSLFSLPGFSQIDSDENQELKEFTATVINAQTEFPLESVSFPATCIVGERSVYVLGGARSAIA